MFDVITDDPSPPAMPAVKKRAFRARSAAHLVTDAANDAGRIAKRHGKQLMWTGNRAGLFGEMTDIGRVIPVGGACADGRSSRPHSCRSRAMAS